MGSLETLRVLHPELCEALGAVEDGSHRQGVCSGEEGVDGGRVCQPLPQRCEQTVGIPGITCGEQRVSVGCEQRGGDTEEEGDVSALKKGVPEREQGGEGQGGADEAREQPLRRHERRRHLHPL